MIERRKCDTVVPLMLHDCSRDVRSENLGITYGGNPGLVDNRAVANGGRCRRTLEAPARVNHNECVYVEVRKHRASCLIV